MSYVGTSRLRVQVAGGRFGAGGTAANASGLYVITHGLSSVRICSAQLCTSCAGATAGNTRWAPLRVSGTALVVQILSQGARVVSATHIGYWFAVG